MAWRTSRLACTGRAPKPSRVLLVNNLLIMALFAAVIVGTLAPTFIELVGGKLTLCGNGFMPTFVYPSLALSLMSLGVWTKFSREGVGGTVLLLLSFAGLLGLAFILSLSGLCSKAGLMSPCALGCSFQPSVRGGSNIGGASQGHPYKPRMLALAHLGLASAVLAGQPQHCCPKSVF